MIREKGGGIRRFHNRSIFSLLLELISSKVVAKVVDKVRVEEIAKTISIGWIVLEFDWDAYEPLSEEHLPQKK